MIDDVEHSVAKTDENADNDELQGMLIELVIQDLFLVGPVQDQAGSILEVELLVVGAVVLEEQIY